MKEDEKFKPAANPEFSKAMAELARSSAASPHDTRPKRERSRKASKDAAIKFSKENDHE